MHPVHSNTGIDGGVSFRLFGNKAKSRPDMRTRSRGDVTRARKGETRISPVRRSTAEQHTTQSFSSGYVRVMVITEVGSRTSTHNGRHDFSALSEDYRLHITICPYFISYMLIAVIIAVIELRWVITYKDFAQSVTIRFVW